MARRLCSVKAGSIVLAVFLGAACVGTEEIGPWAGLPADYRTAFPVVRGCRPSVDHDLAYVIVRVNASSAETYQAGPFPFLPGTLVVKEQFADAKCQSSAGWTLMRKEAPGYDPLASDWRWIRLDSDRHLMKEGKLKECSSCHVSQCKARDFTCTEP